VYIHDQRVTADVQLRECVCEREIERDRERVLMPWLCTFERARAREGK